MAIALTLERLAASRYAGPMSVVLADNASTDATAELAAAARQVTEDERVGAVVLWGGERVFAVGESMSLAFQYQADGLEVAYHNLDLVPAGQFAVTVLKDAPHPNAALLLAAWLSSDEGRDLYEKLIHEADIRPGSKSQLAAEIRQSGAKVILATAISGEPHLAAGPSDCGQPASSCPTAAPASTTITASGSIRYRGTADQPW